VVAGVLALANALVALRRLPETHPIQAVGPENLRRIAPQAAEGGSGRAERGVLGPSRAAGVLNYAVIAFLATAAFAGFEATFSLLGERRFDLTEGSIAAVFVLIGLLLVVVQGGLVRPVTDRLGLPATLRGGLSLTTAGLLVLAGAVTWPLLLGALALLVLGQGLTTPTLTSVVAEATGESTRGQVLGVQQSAGALARIIGPVVAGVLFQRVGLGAPYLLGAGLTGLALVLAVGRTGAKGTVDPCGTGVTSG
jgi:MFS transporter, DHA1 family, tetracycline resistance protein